jgi:hypothetical protein
MTDTEGEFEIYWWGGQKRYKCNQKWSTGDPCQFDTYDREALIRHISQPHSEVRQRKPPAVPPKVVSPIVGPKGEPLVREVGEARFKRK